MGNVIADGIAWARQQLGEHASETVTYSRAGVGTATLTDAVVGKTDFRTNDTAKARVQWGDCDLIVPVASLKLNGVAVTPAALDRFTRTIGGAAVVFEVSAPTGEKAWRHTDSARTHYRIHGKQV